MPPFNLGMVNPSKLNLSFALPHMNAEQALRIEAKKACGSFMGIAWRTYRILGMFILTMDTLPNHEKSPVDHDLKSFWMCWRIGM